MPKLNASEKHDLFLVVDIIKADPKKSSRILKAIELCLKEGDGEGFYVEVKSGLKFDLENQITFTKEGGCPECGFAWPKLDSRYFSPNSLGVVSHVMDSVFSSSMMMTRKVIGRRSLVPIVKEQALALNCQD